MGNPFFYDQIDELVNAIWICYRDTGISNYHSFDMNKARTVVRSLFPKVNPLLLSPKRTVNQLTSKDLFQVDHTGSGILAQLNAAKNKLTETSQRQKWESLKEAFHNLSEGYILELEEPDPNTVEVHFKRSDSHWIPGRQCGLGLNDLITILYFAIFPSNELILIEEPENHVHPDMQRRLATYLKSLKEKTFIISTHSNVFLDARIVDRIFLAQYANSAIIVSDANPKATLLEELGYTAAENITSDLIILVEGPTDCPVVDWMMDGTGLSRNHSIRSVFVGGDNMVHFDLSPFIQQFKLAALVDRDPKSNKARNKFISNCENAGVPWYKTERLTIEHYFPLSAIRQVFPETPKNLLELNPRKPIKDQLGFDVKKQNAKIVQHMKLDDIQQTDLMNFIRIVESILQK